MLNETRAVIFYIVTIICTDVTRRGDHHAGCVSGKNVTRRHTARQNGTIINMYLYYFWNMNE